MPCWPHAWLDQRIDLSTFRPRFDQRAWSRTAGRDASRTQADFDRLVIPRTTRRAILQLWAGLPRGVRSLAVEAGTLAFLGVRPTNVRPSHPFLGPVPNSALGPVRGYGLSTRPDAMETAANLNPPLIGTDTEIFPGTAGGALPPVGRDRRGDPTWHCSRKIVCGRSAPSPISSERTTPRSETEPLPGQRQSLNERLFARLHFGGLISDACASSIGLIANVYFSSSVGVATSTKSTNRKELNNGLSSPNIRRRGRNCGSRFHAFPSPADGKEQVSFKTDVAYPRASPGPRSVNAFLVSSCVTAL